MARHPTTPEDKLVAKKPAVETPAPDDALAKALAENQRLAGAIKDLEDELDIASAAVSASTAGIDLEVCQVVRLSREAQVGETVRPIGYPLAQIELNEGATVNYLVSAIRNGVAQVVSAAEALQ